jgi:2-ketocyclohexanecarboxyl-CoA hydrolase
VAYSEITSTQADGVARITLNRPETLNAFTATTILEALDAMQDAGWNKQIGVVVLTGAGDKAFCVGGDLRGKGKGRGDTGTPLEELLSVIRDIPKPVIARVQGYAIGGGNVLATVCDITIASDRARFGQVGPSVGSVDPGWGTAYLARIVGEKKAREIWYLCRRYSAQEALQMGLCNVVVPHDQLDAEVDKWCNEILEKSPTALAIAKRSFNADSEQIRGAGNLGRQAVRLYFQSEEAQEGKNAFLEKRKPNFRKYVK